jgi:hypothetical protein
MHGQQYISTTEQLPFIGIIVCCLTQKRLDAYVNVCFKSLLQSPVGSVRLLFACSSLLGLFCCWLPALRGTATHCSITYIHTYILHLHCFVFTQVDCDKEQPQWKPDVHYTKTQFNYISIRFTGPCSMPTSRLHNHTASLLCPARGQHMATTRRSRQVLPN